MIGILVGAWVPPGMFHMVLLLLRHPVRAGVVRHLLLPLLPSTVPA